MGRDSIWTFVHWLSLLAIAILAVCLRFVYLTKSRGWVQIGGTVTDVRSVLIGDFATPFVDVVYEYETQSLAAFDLNTHGNDVNDYLPGRIVALLVDPADPTNCCVEQPTTFIDGLLHNIGANLSMRRKAESLGNGVDISFPDKK
jgi:hypothetical protein